MFAYSLNGQTVLFDPRIQSLRVREDLGAMVMKGYTIFPETPYSDCLVSYLGHSLGGSYPFAEMESVYSTAPADWTEAFSKTLLLVANDTKITGITWSCHVKDLCINESEMRMWEFGAYHVTVSKVVFHLFPHKTCVLESLVHLVLPSRLRL